MKTFQCKDAGYSSCNWEVTGQDENQMMQQIREHGEKQHGIKDFSTDLMNKVRSLMRDKKSAA